MTVCLEIAASFARPLILKLNVGIPASFLKVETCDKASKEATADLSSATDIEHSCAGTGDSSDILCLFVGCSELSHVCCSCSVVFKF